MIVPQPTAIGTVRSHTRPGRSLVLDCGGPTVAITVLSPTIVRVRLAPQGAFPARRSWSVVRADEDFPGAAFDVVESDAVLRIQTGAFEVAVERDPCRISFSDAAGHVFCRDARGMSWGRTLWGPGGVACEKHVEPGEHFFGFGERTGMLDKLRREMVHWNVDPPLFHGPGTDPMYIAIPAFLSLRPGLAYGAFFNNTWRSRFDMGRGKSRIWQMEAEGGELDYYVLYGPSPQDVTHGLALLLGKMPLPPRWALGYHQSRWSYESEAVVRELAAEFRRRDIPCDVIHFDIDYMDGFRVFTWDPERMPDPPRLIADLRRDGFRAVTIIDPGVKQDETYHVYRQGMERDAFVRRADGEAFSGYVWPDESVFPDFTRPEVRKWWGDLQRTLLDAGVSGIWNDMNEPTTFERSFRLGPGLARTLPLDAVHGPAGERTTHAEVHNLYGSGMAQACYEGLRRHRPAERPFVLTRSAFAGIQRWSACWMGDNNSWWEHLEMAMPQLMSMGLSGVPFVGTDIGGFHGNASGELFARWMQFGALSPFCRGHSSLGTEQHEPWAFGPRIESICRDYLRLRYRLLPYLYTLFWEASQRGTPVLRPLLFHFPDDPRTYSLHDEVMLGPFLLAAPICQPGREHRAVYLPAATWYGYWNDERFDGPTHLLAHARLDVLPLYVRAGSILPSGPDLNFADERPLDPLTLDVYPGDGELILYDDDGHTYAYEAEEFCTTAYRLARDGDRLTFEFGARKGGYVPPRRRLIVRLHAAGPRSADDHLAARFDAERRILSLEFDDDGQPRALAFDLT